MKKLLLGIALATALSASADNYFAQGTEWTVSDGMIPNVSTLVYKIDGTRDVGDVEAMVMWVCRDGGEQEVAALLDADGDKVSYFDEQAGEWRLLYDFSLREGDEAVVYSPLARIMTENVFPEYVTVKCTGIDYKINGTYEYAPGVMDFNTYADGSEYDFAKWLNGAGSMSDPLMNYYSNLDGAIYRSLLTVVYDGKVVFDYNKMSGIDAVEEPETKAGPAFRLDGTPDNGEPGIYVKDGRKHMRRNM